MKQILVTLAVAVALLITESKARPPDIHDYLDDILQKAREELPDPIRLPPRATFVDLSDGVLWGLSNLTRLGDAKVECVDENSIIIKAKVTTDELKGRYEWHKERKIKSNREGNVVFISHDFEMEVDTFVEKKKGEITHPQLKRLEINKFKDAKVEITGMGYLTWALGEMTTLMSGVFQRSIAHAVQGPLEEALEKQMRDIDIESTTDFDFSGFCDA